MPKHRMIDSKRNKNQQKINLRNQLILIKTPSKFHDVGCGIPIFILIDIIDIKLGAPCSLTLPHTFDCIFPKEKYN